MSQAITSEQGRSLHPATRMGPVTLRVADAERSTRFYQEVLGMQLVGRAAPSASAESLPTLGVDGTPLVRLKVTAGARPAGRVSGLYHFAVLVPSRPALGQA